MNDNDNRSIHWSFWLIASIALIWNVLGAVNFLAQMNPEMLEAYRASERAIIESRPGWATAGFAMAVFGGAIGALLLLLRKSLALYFFFASLLGVVVTMIHTLGADIEFGPGELAGIIALPLVLAAFLIWYTRQAESKGWIT